MRITTVALVSLLALGFASRADAQFQQPAPYQPGTGYQGGVSLPAPLPTYGLVPQQPQFQPFQIPAFQPAPQIPQATICSQIGLSIVCNK